MGLVGRPLSRHWAPRRSATERRGASGVRTTALGLCIRPDLPAGVPTDHRHRPPIAPPGPRAPATRPPDSPIQRPRGIRRPARTGSLHGRDVPHDRAIHGARPGSKTSLRRSGAVAGRQGTRVFRDQWPLFPNRAVGRLRIGVRDQRNGRPDLSRFRRGLVEIPDGGLRHCPAGHGPARCHARGCPALSTARRPGRQSTAGPGHRRAGCRQHIRRHPRFFGCRLPLARGSAERRIKSRTSDLHSGAPLSMHGG